MLIPVSSVFIMFTFLAIGETSAFAAPVDFMVTTCAVFLLMVNLLVFGINQYNQKKSQEFTDMQLLLQKESDSVAYYEMMLSQNENQYQRQCNDKHIALHTDIRSGTVQTIYQHDLTSLFCNLFDNAVESAEKIPDSFIELRVQKKENSPFIIIIVINSCRSAPQSDAAHLPISTKKDSSKHGDGMKSIKKVIRKYNGDLQMYYDDASATFHTIVTLKNIYF